MVKIKERTCGKGKKSIGTVKSIKVLPVIPTFKVQETKRNKNNLSYTLQEFTGKYQFFQNRFEENLSKFALCYVYAAIGTLPFRLGQNVMWNTASVRTDKNLVQDKDQGFGNTEMHEGVVNFESIT